LFGIVDFERDSYRSTVAHDPHGTVRERQAGGFQAA
jgi:hypothetical protein